MIVETSSFYESRHPPACSWDESAKTFTYVHQREWTWRWRPDAAVPHYETATLSQDQI